MSGFRWTPQRMDQLERATRDGRRVLVARRGTEFIVIARRLTTAGPHDALVGHLPITGEELVFPLHELDDFQVIA